jgi:MFS family permease
MPKVHCLPESIARAAYSLHLDYIDTMKIGHIQPDGTPKITKALLQGGIISVYYLGTLVGALFGGWAGEKIGRIRMIAAGAAWSAFGVSLQCSAQNHNW